MKKIIVILIFVFYIKINSSEGPMSQEFIKHTAVGNNDYVNKFNGQFNYSIPIITIPGPGGSGYEMALTYTSGSSPESEASWVGFGWQLSPGAINRQMNGIPDDFNNIPVKKYEKFRPVYTSTNTLSINLEKSSKDTDELPEWIKKYAPDALSITMASTFNNHNKFNTSYGIGATSSEIFGTVGFSKKNTGGLSFNYSVSLSDVFKDFQKLHEILPMQGKKNLDNSIQLYNSIYGVELNYNKGFPTSNMSSKNHISSRNLKLHGGVFGIKIEATVPPMTYNYSQEPINLQPISKNVFGALYLGESKTSADILDFNIENDTEFNQRDKFLPIPFHSKDVFIVSTNKLSGSFECKESVVGSAFRKNSVENITTKSGFGITAGLSIGGIPPSAVIGLGGDYKGGYTNNFINSKYIKNNHLKLFKYETDDDLSYVEKVRPNKYFQFKNDLGTDDSYFTNNNIDFNSKYSNFQGKEIRSNKLNEGYSYLSSSKNIKFIRNRDINSNSTKYFHRYIYDNLINMQNIDKDIIMAYEITDEDGQKFEFGLPVFTRNNVNLSYGLNKLKKTGTNQPEIFSHTNDNYRIYHSISPLKDANNANNEPHIMLGEEINEPYPSSYLLTNIYSNDYIDLNNDGPSSDDVGTYTSFSYFKTAGSDDKLKDNEIIWGTDYNNSNTMSWFKFRNPYNGFNYSKGRYSDRLDDMISFNSGEKELYYLNTIQTKTHIAVFVVNQSSSTFINANNNEVFEINGSSNNRKDNFEAVHNEYFAGSSSTVTSASSSTINKKKYLERIELWTIDTDNPKDESGRIRLKEHLKTVKFEYDYSVWPNQISSLEENEKRLGKLTLKKVWTEYGNVKSKENSPYNFSYLNNNDNYEIYNGNIIQNFNNGSTPAVLDDPDYNYLDVNAWGNYEPDNLGGLSKKQYYINSLNQNNSNTFSNKGNHTYDPSAWQLKKVTLPSDGEIHIDYERNEYSHVQNKPSMVFAYVKEGGYDYVNGLIELDLNKTLGLNFNSDIDKIKDIQDEINSYISKIDEFNFTNYNKFHFSFYYGLIKESQLELGYSNIEKIDGWATIEKCSLDIPNEKFILKFKDKSQNFTPKKLCGQFFDNNANLISKDEGDYKRLNDVILTTSTSYSNAVFTMDKAKSEAFSKVVKAFQGINGSQDKFCKSIIEDVSRVRIPIPAVIPKKGGGIRVKRILFKDGFDYLTKGHSDRIYGKEYVYENENGTTSGVASNEPPLLGNENSLMVSYEKRNKDSKFDGTSLNPLNVNVNYEIKDIEQFDGLIGKSIYPTQTIEYSRVITKDLYNISTHSGFEINEYYTTRDYPTLRKISDNIKTINYSEIKIDDPVANIFSGNRHKKLSAKQGYMFLINNYSGLLKRTAKYGGNYDMDKSKWTLSYEKKVDYFDFNNEIPILNKKFKIEKTLPGLEVDLINYQFNSESYNLDLSPDIDLSFPIPFSFDIGYSSNLHGPAIYYIKSNTNTNSMYVSNKIVNVPVIQKSVTTYVDGVKNIEENIAFNKYTGKPIVKRVNNKFGNESGETYDIVDIPASYIYDNLSQKSKGNVGHYEQPNWTPLHDDIDYNIGISRKKMKIGDDDIYLISFDPFGDNPKRGRMINTLIEGTIIKVKNTNSYLSNSSYEEYYVVTDKTDDFIYVKPYLNSDLGIEDDLPYSEMRCDIEIIEPGFKNMLNLSLGQVIKESSNSDYVFDRVRYRNNEIDSSYSFKQEIADSINSKLKWIAESINNVSSFTFNGDINAYDKPNYQEFDLDLLTGAGNFVKVFEDYVPAYPYSSVNYPAKIKNVNGTTSYITRDKLLEDNALIIRNFRVDERHNLDKDGNTIYYSNYFLKGSFELAYNRHDGMSSETSATFHPFSDDIMDVMSRSVNLNLKSIFKKLNLPESKNPSLTLYQQNKLKNYIYEETGYNELRGKVYNIYNYENDILRREFFYCHWLIDDKMDFPLKDFVIKKNGDEIIGIYLESNKIEFNEDMTNFTKYFIDGKNIKYSFDEIDENNYNFYINGFHMINNYQFDNSNIFKTNEILKIDGNILKNKNTISTYDAISESSKLKFYNSTISDDECTSKVEFSIPLSSTSFIGLDCKADYNRDYYNFNHNVFFVHEGFIDVKNQVIYEPNQLENSHTINLEDGLKERDYFCINFAEEYDDIFYIKDVLSAQVSELSNSWTKYDLTSNTFLNAENSFLNGERGRWNVVSNYTYRNDIVKSKDLYASNNIRDNSSFYEYDLSEATVGAPFDSHGNPSLTFNLAGEYKDKPYFVLYNWDAPNINDEFEWIYDKKNISIDKNGIVNKSVDYIGNLTSSSFNDLGQVLYESVYCNNDEILFNDFENESNTFAHTGLSSGTIGNILSEVGIINLKPNTTYEINFWYKNNMVPNPTFSFNLESSPIIPTLIYKQPTGDWALHKSEFYSGSNSGTFTFKLSCAQCNEPFTQYYIDDFLVKPKDAIVKKYVYNKNNFQLLSELDNEHFASYYKYDNQNRLSEIYKETYNGVKLLKQTSYNQPKEVVYTGEQQQGQQMMLKDDNTNKLKKYNLNPYKNLKHRFNPNMLPEPRLKDKNEGFGNKFDIFKFELNKDGLEYDFFNVPIDSLKQLKEDFEKIKIKSSRDSLILEKLKNKLDMEKNIKDIEKNIKDIEKNIKDIEKGNFKGLDSLDIKNTYDYKQLKLKYKELDEELILDSLKNIKLDSLKNKKIEEFKDDNKNVEVKKEIRK